MAKKKTTAPKAASKTSCEGRAGCGSKAKNAKKTATKKAVTSAAKKETKAPKTAKKKSRTQGAVPSNDAVGFRLRMTPNTHKMLKTKADNEGVSQNTFINQLIENAK